MSDKPRANGQRGRPAMDCGPLAPVFTGPEGILFDFNYGCRVRVPVNGWRVCMYDLDTGNVVLDEQVEADEIVASMRKYYVRFLLEVFDGPRRVFSHAFDATAKKVRLRMGPWSLGDSIAWIPVIDVFRKQHSCEIYLPMGEHLQLLYREGYPELHFAAESQLDAQGPYYATYYFGWITPFFERDHQPTDPRISSMQDTAAYQLGVPPKERKVNIVIERTERTITERYVCIATQSTAQRKYWNNPDGWSTVVIHLKKLGYRVLCVDRYVTYGDDEYTNTMPAGAENFTGNRTLQERASLIRHADFFIGLSSGLSWLAWATNVPVVMISGFTHPSTEFYTPYRVINFHVCNSCLNDTNIEFAPDIFARCPRRQDGPGRFVCTSAITPHHVIRVIGELIHAHKLA